MALSSTKIIKVIVVTDDLDKTVSAYKALFGTDRTIEEGEHHNLRTPYT